MAAKRIEGYTSGEFGEELAPYLSVLEVYSKGVTNTYPCTVIISETSDPPKVWTEEEVKAMIKEAFRGYDRSGSGVSWDRVKQIASEHGLDFDNVEIVKGDPFGTAAKFKDIL